ncbi:LOW QUALITY PROTEIN: protein CREG2 [Glossophaga mutica]
MHATLEFNLVFQEPRLLQVVRSCQDIPPAGGSCCRGKGVPAPSFCHRGVLLTSPAIGDGHVLPGTSLSWLLCSSTLLSLATGYMIMSSVSWAVTDQVDEELDSHSTEEATPMLLEDSGRIWQQSFLTSVHKEVPHLPKVGHLPYAQMFSYPRESSFRLYLDTAILAHTSAWGCLATLSTHEKIPDLPFGNCVLISDGPLNNSTGIPFFYVTPKDSMVADLMKNPVASLLLPELEGEFFR